MTPLFQFEFCTVFCNFTITIIIIIISIDIKQLILGLLMFLCFRTFCLFIPTYARFLQQHLNVQLFTNKCKIVINLIYRRDSKIVMNIFNKCLIWQVLREKLLMLILEQLPFQSFNPAINEMPYFGFELLQHYRVNTFFSDIRKQYLHQSL